MTERVIVAVMIRRAWTVEKGASQGKIMKNTGLSE